MKSDLCDQIKPKLSLELKYLIWGKRRKGGWSGEDHWTLHPIKGLLVAVYQDIGNSFWIFSMPVFEH